MAREIYFPDGIIDSSIVMIEHVEPRKPNIWAFFLPFQPAVWILFAFTILITGSLYWLLEQVNHFAHKQALDSSPFDAIFTPH